MLGRVVGYNKTRRGGGGSIPIKLHECIPGKDRVDTYEAVAAYLLLTVACHFYGFLNILSKYRLYNDFATNAACALCLFVPGRFLSVDGWVACLVVIQHCVCYSFYKCRNGSFAGDGWVACCIFSISWCTIGRIW